MASTESSDYYKYLGIGALTEVLRETVKDGKIIRSTVLVSVNENCCEDELYQAFKNWLANEPGVNKELFNEGGNLKFSAEMAATVIKYLKKWNFGKS